MSARRLSLRAPAKINAWLEVLGRRPDGYHELVTWMLTLELADRLVGELDPRGNPGEVRLELAGPAASADVPRDGRNLAVRAAAVAARRVAELTGAPPPAILLRLVKDVPSQAGLGGGSSDAAAALRLVEGLCDVDLGDPWRRALLAELGSDCVFFDAAREAGAARCAGRGERVEPCPAPSPEWWVALVTPAVACPTRQVFEALDSMGEKNRSREPRPEPPVRIWLTRPASEACAGLHNTLEAAALAAIPELRPWRSALDAAGGRHFRLSGSGSTFFGLFDTAWEATASLLAIVDEARRRSLALRGRWVTRTRAAGEPPARVGA